MSCKPKTNVHAYYYLYDSMGYSNERKKLDRQIDAGVIDDYYSTVLDHEISAFVIKKKGKLTKNEVVKNLVKIHKKATGINDPAGIKYMVEHDKNRSF